MEREGGNVQATQVRKRKGRRGVKERIEMDKSVGRSMEYGGRKGARTT